MTSDLDSSTAQPPEAPIAPASSESLLTAARLARRGGGGGGARMETPPPPPACRPDPSVLASALARALLLQCHREEGGASAGGRERCRQTTGGHRRGLGEGEKEETGVGGGSDTRGPPPPSPTGLHVVKAAQTTDAQTDREGRTTSSADRQMAVVSVSVSNCRRTWRQARRCRGSMLPAIAEGGS